MHICLVTPSFPPLVDGGVAIATGRLVEHLRRRGHHVTVVTAMSQGAVGHIVASDLVARADVPLHYGVVDDPLQDAPAVQALCAWAQAQHQQRPFDVILAYFIYPGGYLGTILGQALRLPVVCSCRGNDISKAMFMDPQTIATVLQRSTRLIFVSASLLRMADTLVPCRGRATVVANGVDSTVFTPALYTANAPCRPVVLGTSGVLRWKKGLDLLLPLIRDLCATHEVQMLIAGYGLDTTVDQQIADFLTRHQLTSRVEVTGPLPHPQMVHALQRMDFYVSTSYQEGMPNGVLEAMACALPVVATDADAVPELIVDGVTGYLCRMGDLAALAACCRTCIEHPELRQRMGRAGRQRIQQTFTPEREAAAVEAVLSLACRQEM